MKILLSALLCLSLSLPAAAAEPPSRSTLVAAASDLKFALDEIARDFVTAGGPPVSVTYGSSGNFFRQIVQGAPFELFLSADEDLVFKLADQGFAADRGALYAIGRIVVFVPTLSRVRPDISGLAAAAADGRLLKLAIANPEHAPYGRAAMQALSAAGVWDRLQPRLVLGENASQAAQFAVSGSAQAGIFAYSLALAPAFANAGTFTLIPAAVHAPLRQRMVLLRTARPDARAFHEFLQQPQARAVFKRYGFELPGDSR